MKKLILLILILIYASTLSAQKYYKGSLYFIDGKVMNGLVKIPSDPHDKKIEFKKANSDEKISFDSEILKSITISVDDSSQYEFVREIGKKPTSKKGNYKILDPAWLTVLVKGHATLYAAGQAFKVSKRGELIIRGSWTGGVPPDTHFFLKRPGEENPSWV
jgi:hypothetical protein